MSGRRKSNHHLANGRFASPVGPRVAAKDGISDTRVAAGSIVPKNMNSSILEPCQDNGRPLLEDRDADALAKSWKECDKMEKIFMNSFQQNLTPAQFNQVVAASNDEDDPPALFSIHMTTLQQFVNAVIAYSGPVPPPVGLILPAVVTSETLMVALLDYLRGVGTPSPSPPPIGIVCLPCSQAQLVNVGVRAERLESSQWVAALVASAPLGVAIAPIASMWTTSSRESGEALTSIVTHPLPPMALWD